MIQIPRVGAPDEPVLEGWTVSAALGAVTSRIRLATLCTAEMWTEQRTTFHGRYFHVEDAILEPKPVGYGEPPSASSTVIIFSIL
jgi:alkanesulfonate monooxygenase SsuD/methylene tetrahydromethanopterin reductase-like flavin-dependent oxidoreductase (luciferase family)